MQIASLLHFLIYVTCMIDLLLLHSQNNALELLQNAVLRHASHAPDFVSRVFLTQKSHCSSTFTTELVRPVFAALDIFSRHSRPGTFNCLYEILELQRRLQQFV